MVLDQWASTEDELSFVKSVWINTLKNRLVIHFKEQAGRSFLCIYTSKVRVLDWGEDSS
jgi:hypothetical protein